jgi:hypothetical protein
MVMERLELMSQVQRWSVQRVMNLQYKSRSEEKCLIWDLLLNKTQSPVPVVLFSFHSWRVYQMWGRWLCMYMHVHVGQLCHFFAGFSHAYSTDRHELCFGWRSRVVEVLLFILFQVAEWLNLMEHCEHRGALKIHFAVCSAQLQM